MNGTDIIRSIWKGYLKRFEKKKSNNWKKMHNIPMTRKRR